MKNLERLQQVEELFHAALEREPNERAAFLSEACGSDAALLSEVKSLLAADARTGSFIDSPTYKVESSIDHPSQSLVGCQIGHYQIKSQIGRGGMGEIYLAKDMALNRPVALKLLPAHFTKDENRLRRFKQESRAASLLNHPNILTIYEIGETDGSHFIATEYIEGETMRHHMNNDSMSIRDVLDTIIQVASALAAAHKAGIVHRDIKPENIMLRLDGYVKVLDFGLAKLTEKPRSQTDSDTFSIQNTDPGMIMGTVQYMSPEQARGKEVDARTDIFSFGVMLYEIIARRPPFTGESSTDVLAAILDKEPPPLAQYAPEVPDELLQIISKTLSKEQDNRYQTTEELLVDLKDLRDNLQVQFRLGQANRSGSQNQATPVAAVEITKNAAASSSEVVERTTSRAEYLVSQIKNHKGVAALILTAFIVMAVGMTFWLFKFIRQNKPLSLAQNVKITQLTSTGKVLHSAISPDGKYIVYVLGEGGQPVKDERGQQSLWITQVTTSSHVQIVPPDDVTYIGITFAPDGNSIYYVRRDKENANGALYQLPLLGGNARKLLSNISSPIAMSPDGKQLTFVRWNFGPQEDSVMIANADGTEEKKLSACKYPEQFNARGLAWSPDGKFIALGMTALDDVHIIGVRVADGAKQRFSSKQWESGSVTRIAWLADNSGILLSYMERLGNPSQIWYLGWQNNEARQITNDLNSYTDIMLTADSRLLAAVRTDQIVNLWLAPDGDASQARQLTFGTARDDGSGGISWTTDGKIVYCSNAGGLANIWTMTPDGTGNRQLTANAHMNSYCTASPDSRYILWNVWQPSRPNIWRMEMDGSSPRQITKGAGELFPQISPDGKWLIYMDLDNFSQKRVLAKIPIDGGEAMQLTDKSFSTPVISPDGKLIAANRIDEASGQFKIVILPFEGGSPIRTFDVLDPNSIRPFQWTPDSHSIAYIRTSNNVSNIWAQPLDGSPPKQLTDFKEQRIFNFAWSRDGKQLALSRGFVNSDVVLIRDFK